MLKIHEKIIDKLDVYIKNNKIPNIIFHGNSGSGKKEIVKHFINKIYNNDKELIKTNVMIINCSHGGGIKFIRDELKFFAKSNVNFKLKNIFKSIILLNADCLTTDAQSALRRCIELFSNTSRFFIVIENKYKLLKPIISRFCDIYIPLPIVKNKQINLHKYNIECIFDNKEKNTINSWLKKQLGDINSDDSKKKNIKELCILTDKIYNQGLSALDVMNYFQNHTTVNENFKYKFILYFNKIKKEYRNEKILILNILYYIFLRSEFNLENILNI